jgi:hypothetical protein
MFVYNSSRNLLVDIYLFLLVAVIGRPISSSLLNRLYSHSSHRRYLPTLKLISSSVTISTVESEVPANMDFDDSVMLPSQDDDSFLLSTRPISSPLRQTQIPERNPIERESRRATGGRKLEDGRRRTEEIVARLREERKKRESRDRTVSSSASMQGVQPLSTQTVSKKDRVDDQEKGEWEDIQDPGKENGELPDSIPNFQAKLTGRLFLLGCMENRLYEAKNPFDSKLAFF